MFPYASYASIQLHSIHPFPICLSKKQKDQKYQYIPDIQIIITGFVWQS